MVAGIFTEGNYVMEIDSWLLQFIHRFLFISSKFCKDSQEKKKNSKKHDKMETDPFGVLTSGFKAKILLFKSQ